MSTPLPISDSRFGELRLKGLIGWPTLTILVFLVVGFLPPRSRGGGLLTAAAYAFYATLLLAALLAARRAGISPRDVFGPSPRTRRPWLLAAGLAPLLLTFAAVALVALLSAARLFAPDWAASQMRNAEGPEIISRLLTHDKVLLVLVLTVVAPIVEEIVFRGLLMRKWAAARGFWTGVIGSSLVFAVLHPPSWIGSFVFGVVVSILYLWSGSLVVAIVVHSLNNIFVTIAVAGGSGAAGSTAAAENPLAAGPHWTSTLLLLVIVGAAILMIVQPLLRELRPVQLETGSA